MTETDFFIANPRSVAIEESSRMPGQQSSAIGRQCKMDKERCRMPWHYSPAVEEQ